MRTIEEMRARLLGQLDGACRRPSMYGGSDTGIETVLGFWLDDLCFIDDRKPELDRAHEDLRRRGLFLATGVIGGFCRHVSEKGYFARSLFGSEIASVYARVAHGLGYLTLDRVLTDGEWRSLRKGLRTACRARDWRGDEILERFGTPSLCCGRTIFAYATDVRGAGWIYFDFDAVGRTWEPHDFLLRNVRVPAKQFARELTFTPHGNRSRHAEGDRRP